MAEELLAIEVHALDSAYLPLPNTVLQWSWKNGKDVQPLSALGKTDSAGIARASLTPLNSGVLELQATRPGYEERGYNARELFVVAPKTVEFERRDVNVEEFRRWVESSQGAIYSLRDSLPDKFDAFYRQARYRSAGQVELPLWDQWVSLVLLLSIASFEWWFRRRHGGA